MKIINDRYKLIKRISKNSSYNKYYAKDLFNNKKVYVKIFDKDNQNKKLFQNYYILKEVYHTNLYKYYNFEKIWFVDGQLSNVDYYALINEFFDYQNIITYDTQNNLEESKKIELLNHLFLVIFYLNKYNIYIDKLNQNNLKILEDKLKLDILDQNLKKTFNKDDFDSLIESIVQIFEMFTYKEDKKLNKYLNFLNKVEYKDIDDLINKLKSENYFEENKFNYLEKKEIWTTKEIGLSVHLDILKDLYSYQIKRNSKICFVMYGRESSFKTILIEDFLNYLKHENYLKIEIIMRNFHDFLKYLFYCLKHYKLYPKLNDKINKLFESYYETLDDNFLLRLQDNLIKLLFNFSITKKVVLHVKNIVGIDDRIVKFINLILHLPRKANVVIIFDAVIEKSRFDVFYKKPKFKILTKEYAGLDDNFKEKLLNNIICYKCNNKPILDIINKYDLNYVFPILNFLEKIHRNNYLKIDTKNKKISLNNQLIEKNKVTIFKDDSLNKCINYLKEREKEILWYLSNTNNPLTLKDFINLLDEDRETALEYLGTLRVHAYIEEIWEEEDNPFYKIVNEEIRSYFLTNKFKKVSKYRKKFINFLIKNNEKPEMIVNLILLLYEDNYFYTAIDYIFYLMKNFVLIDKDCKKILKIVKKLIDYPKSIHIEWKIKWSYLNILKTLDKKDKLSKYLDKLFNEYKEKSEKIDEIQIWYVLAYYYKKYYNNNYKDKINIIYNIIKKKTKDEKYHYFKKFLIFLFTNDEKTKNKLVDYLLDKKDSKLPLNLELIVKQNVLSYLYNIGNFEKIRKKEDRLVNYFSRNDNGEYNVGKIIKAFYLKIGNFILDKGDAHKAHDYYKKSLIYAKKNKDYSFMIKLHNNIATAKYYMGREDKEIIKELKKAVSLGEKIENHEAIVVALANIANLYAMNFYYKRSYKYIKDALKYSDDTISTHKYLIVLQQYITLLVKLGDYSKAYEYAKKYKQKTEDKDSLLEKITYDYILSIIYYYEEKYDKAIENLNNYINELKTHNVYGYDLVEASLFVINIYLHKGKKTKARNLYNEITNLVKDKKIDIGSLEIDMYQIYFMDNLQRKIDKLEDILNSNKKRKKNSNILKILLELSKFYGEKEFRYRLYEIYSEILFFEEQIKKNFPKDFIKNYRKSYYIKKIQERKEEFSKQTDIPLKEIKFNNIIKKWKKYYKDNISNFFNINMTSLMNNWIYSLKNSKQVRKLVLKYILNISNADRVIMFKKKADDSFVPVEIIENIPVYNNNEYRNDLINSTIKKLYTIQTKSYDSFSSEIIKAGIYPIVHHSFSIDENVKKEKRNNVKEFYDYIEALIYIDSKNYCNYINKNVNEYIFPFVQYLTLLYNFDEVQEDIIICPLTKVFTRSYFLKELDEIIKKRKRNKTIGLMLLDIDDLKKINSKYGNEIGDNILYEISKELRNNTRSYDLVGRYMGDEFIISFMKISKEELKEKAELLLKSIHKNEFIKKYNAGVSIGLSFIPDNGEKSEIVISKAIAAMISSKNKENKISLWQEEYGLYRGKHDILAGIINKDISTSERIIRNLTELIMLSPKNLKDFFDEITTIMSRLFKYDYIYLKIKTKNEEYEKKDEKIKIVDAYIKKSQEKNDSIVSLNWGYEEETDSLYSDLTRKRVYEENNIEVVLYLSICMDNYEYNYNDANLINILSKIILGHLYYLNYKINNKE